MRSEPTHTLFSVAQQRLNRDLECLKFQRKTSNFTSFKVSFPYRDGLYLILPVSFCIIHQDSIYKSAVFQTVIKVSPGYPYKSPTMIVKNQVYHLNIDIDSGEVYLKILKVSTWQPDFTINNIISAFELILINPDLDFLPLNPINHEIREVLLSNPEEFQYNVKKTLNGGFFMNKYFFEPMYGKSNPQTKVKSRLLDNTKRPKYSRNDW